MRPPSETFTTVVLSTGHITKGTADALDEIVAMQASEKGQLDVEDWRYWLIASRWSSYGWWVWANVEDGRDNMPADLIACLDYAREHGCRWILFDCDGPLERDLTRYDW